MNMKNAIRMTWVALLATGLTLNSCKKNDNEMDEDGLEQAELSFDESNYNNELEASLNEANTTVSSSGVGKGPGIPGAKVDDSTFINEKKIVITYDGLSGDGLRMRTGTVILQLISGAKWSDAGAVLSVEAQNLKITRVSTGKSVTLNGVHYITNVTGGKVLVDENVVHSVRGNTQVTFDNGTMRSWQVARKRTYTNAAGQLSLKVEGDTAVGGYSNVVVWGTNRRGNAFYTQITSPLLFTTTCSNRPVSGVKVHNSMSKNITVTFGVDASGNPYSGSDCPYGFKISWVDRKGNTRTSVSAY
jgi:hypothetical protein